MAEVGSLQVDHSYKRVVESWFPDLFRNEQSKSKASDAGGRKSDVGNDRSESESTSLEKPSPKSQKKKKETVPMATKIGSLVEGKILPKLKKRQHQQQNQQGGGNPGNKVPTADPDESEDQDSKLKSLSQQKQQISPQQGGQKMSRSQVRRMKRRQKKEMEQQAAGTQGVPEPVTGQFPTLENLLQSPSKLSQGKVDGSEQNKDKDKKNNGPKQSPSHTGLNVKVETPSQKQKAGNKEKESISPTNSWGMKDSTGKKASTPSTQMGQMEPQTPGKTVNGGGMSSPRSKKKKTKKEQQSQGPSVTESPKSSKQTAEKQLESNLKLSSLNAEAKDKQASPIPAGINKRKRPHATHVQEQPSSALTVSPKQDSAASNKTADTLLKGDLKQVEVSQDESGNVPKKRRRRRRSKSKEPPSKDLAESKEDTADSKNLMNVIQVNLFISPTGNGEQVGNLEGEVSTPGDGKKKRKQRKAKKVVTPEKQEPHAPVEPSPKKPKLQNQPDLPGGTAKQAMEKQMSASSVSPASPTGQETSPTKKAKKKRKNSLVSEQGSGKKTVEENIVSNTEGTPAKKQRLSVEENEADTGVQPSGALKRRRRARGKRKRTASEQSQSSETEDSTAVEPGSEECATVSSAKPEDESATTLSPKKRKRRRRNRHKKDAMPGEA